MTALDEIYREHTFHAEQDRFYRCGKRFIVVPAGRRSGKTEIAKRKMVKRIINGAPEGNYLCAAPTHAQAKKIFWRDMKRLTQTLQMPGTRPSESELSIELFNGSRIWVFGTEKVERLEGIPLDGVILDEYASMDEDVWPLHVAPMLDDPSRPKPGWAIFTGVPEGRNHYYRMFNEAQVPDREAWTTFHWKSSEVLAPKVIEEAMRNLDAMSYDQEYNASFLSFAGAIYYTFDRDVHVSDWAQYDPSLPLHFCFDFNVAPGVAVICQNQTYTASQHGVAKQITAVIGEVHIPRGSNTPMVCRKLVADWGTHPGRVICYGDSTGGARGTAKVDGSDWDLIKRELGKTWADRMTFTDGIPIQAALVFRVPRANPPIRARVNSVNSRFLTAKGDIHCLINPKCVHLIEDLEGVVPVEGSAGEIDKSDDTLTHLTDAFGYYIQREHPMKTKKEVSQTA